MAKSKPAPPNEPVAAWAPADDDCIVSDAKTFIVWVGTQRYEHVRDAPDGRWVYRQS